MICSKINMDSADEMWVRGKRVKIKHDIQTQNVFRRVVERATGRGMVVNAAKTKVICVSDAQTYKAECKFEDDDGNTIRSGEKMKILGFHMDSRPSCHAHVEAMRVRMRDTMWVLRHLGRAGFSEQELARDYSTIIRPILDYCAAVYYPMITDEQDQKIERMQATALKSIYGFGISYAKMRKLAGITTHRARRIELCDKFAKKALDNPRFGEVWFPERQSVRRGRHTERFLETAARTDRLHNSPLFYF